MLKTQLTAARNGRELHSVDGWNGEPTPVQTTYGAAHGVFNSEIANNNTVTIAAPDGAGALVLTDLIVSADKLNNGVLTVDVFDTLAHVEIIVRLNTDLGIGLAISFAGRWQTWASAIVRLTMAGAKDANCALGYFKVDAEHALSYEAWDALR